MAKIREKLSQKTAATAAATGNIANLYDAIKSTHERLFKSGSIAAQTSEEEQKG